MTSPDFSLSLRVSYPTSDALLASSPRTAMSRARLVVGDPLSLPPPHGEVEAVVEAAKEAVRAGSWRGERARGKRVRSWGETGRTGVVALRGDDGGIVVGLNGEVRRGGGEGYRVPQGVAQLDRVRYAGGRFVAVRFKEGGGFGVLAWQENEERFTARAWASVISDLTQRERPKTSRSTAAAEAATDAADNHESETLTTLRARGRLIDHIRSRMISSSSLTKLWNDLACSPMVADRIALCEDGAAVIWSAERMQHSSASVKLNQEVLLGKNLHLENVLAPGMGRRGNRRVSLKRVSWANHHPSVVRLVSSMSLWNWDTRESAKPSMVASDLAPHWSACWDEMHVFSPVPSSPNLGLLLTDHLACLVDSRRAGGGAVVNSWRHPFDPRWGVPPTEITWAPDSLNGEDALLWSTEHSASASQPVVAMSVSQDVSTRRDVFRFGKVLGAGPADTTMNLPFHALAGVFASSCRHRVTFRRQREVDDDDDDDCNNNNNAAFTATPSTARVRMLALGTNPTSGHTQFVHAGF